MSCAVHFSHILHPDQRRQGQPPHPKTAEENHVENNVYTVIALLFFRLNRFS